MKMIAVSLKKFLTDCTAVVCVVVMCLVAAAQAQGAAYDVNDRRGWDVADLDTARNVDYLSDLEKDVILELNMVRSDPGRYAEMYILPRVRYFQGNQYVEPGKITLLTNEGARAIRECYDELTQSAARPLLYPSRSLSRAARDHVADTGPTGMIGHTGRDGS